MANFTLTPYHRDLLGGMTTLYNAETAFEPYIVPLTSTRFVEFIESKSYFDAAALLVAVAGGEVVGWIHACRTPGTESWHSPEKIVSRLQMLIFPRQRLEVGTALVRAATAYLEELPSLADRKAMTIEAMHPGGGYPFYRGLWMGGEPMGLATLPHVQLALEVGGYKTTFESVFLTAALDAAPPEVSPSLPVTFLAGPAPMAHPTMAESWSGFAPQRISAQRGGEEIGSIGWTLLPHVAERLGASGMTIWQLGVAEAYRRYGIASALISHALRAAHAQRARHAFLGTQLWNAPAHAAYARFGFHPHGLLLGRERRIDV
jgi:ribosomal protein S18 acetylase RimI-like enzyme